MQVCANCGTENPDGFRLCGMCGTALAVTIGGERRERRVVSVLFADLVGFTSRSERWMWRTSGVSWARTRRCCG